MNYGKQGALDKQQPLAAKAPKWGRKLLLFLLKLTLVVCLSAGIVAAGGVLRVLKGVIDTSPDISQMTIAPAVFPPLSMTAREIRPPSWWHPMNGSRSTTMWWEILPLPPISTTPSPNRSTRICWLPVTTRIRPMSSYTAAV